ncbi:hypothetical protein [Legionella tunisiensis]|uniref:hypothetical protein n=1 Tax=Legionella tunisiensis TaxID=1034944 RepID=UPI000310110C|nr:hypothetical protein [Legionella tunisiensis]
MPSADKPNYVETDTVPDPDNPGYARFRPHVFFGGPAPTHFGNSTPEPTAGLYRINRGLNDPAVRQQVADKLQTIARNQQTSEALEDILPEALISLVNKF